MAIVRDNLTGLSLGGTGATSMTFAHTVNDNTNGYLVVMFKENGGSSDDVTGVTYNGVAMSLLKKDPQQSTYPVLFIYGLAAPASGAHNVVISRSGTSGDFAAMAVSYTGVKQTAQPDAVISAKTASATTQTGTLTTIANNSIAVAFFGSSAGGLTASTGCTLLDNGGIGVTAGFESSSFPITPAGSYSMTATCSSGTIGMVAISLAPLAAITLDCAVGAFALTGKSITTNWLIKTLNVDVGQFVLTGIKTVLSKIGWSATSKHTATFTAQNKHTATLTAQDKHTATFTAQNKHTATLTAQDKHTATFTPTNKS